MDRPAVRPELRAKRCLKNLKRLGRLTLHDYAVGRYPAFQSPDAGRGRR